MKTATPLLGEQKINRRSVIKTAAWAVPVVAVAVAAPAAASSVPPQPVFTVTTTRTAGPWNPAQDWTWPGFVISVANAAGPVAVSVTFTPAAGGNSPSLGDIAKIFNMSGYTRTGPNSFSISANLTPGGATGGLVIDLRKAIANGTFSVAVTGGSAATIIVSGAPGATVVTG